ncbi:NAD(P)H-dependent oxidoreductase [Mucilaginibacter agri]|uniref:NAD(P)H-dependent oxidoreductase n=1 Tax=Mucilaginibacter agri TaxID=2695265 RepID=A0A965ZFQ1_9SPHI|nr:NAD(P)H-dependent oxidoreductase [Mucilaginibacter agri]NCD69358.1 NAD(P)H-dependent oxidoreductase [Mucilaginibacter agri]
MSLIDKLSWRYATKKFDANKKIAADKLEQLLATVRLAPSSLGLHHYKVIVVENPEVREQLKAAAYGQTQITDASQLIVFAAETNIDEAYVNKYVDEIVKVRQIPHDSLEGYKGMMLGSVNGQTTEQKIAWAHKQAYIGLGVLVSAAAELDIDSCPMEGFNPAQFDEILGLKEKGLTTSVIVTIGYRSAEDATANFVKVRKPAEELFVNV